MSIVSNLFPPIVKDVEAAFIKTASKFRIYFSLSSYNSIEEIYHAQVTIVNQKNNQTILDSSEWPLGIKFFQCYGGNNQNFQSIGIDSSINNDYKYYIDINLSQTIYSQLQSFEQDAFYRIQIRFGNIALPSASDEAPDAEWITDHINNFSEWSSICLIKAIDQPSIKINELSSESKQQLSIPLTSITGKMYFSDNTEKQTLKSYNIILKDSENNIILKSNEIITNQYNPNEFSYQIQQDLQPLKDYTLLFNYTTINLYNQTISFEFLIKENDENELNAIFKVTPEEENGRMKIDITFKNIFNVNSSLMIKRSSSKTNFRQWENIKEIPHEWHRPNNTDELPYGDFQHLWYDTTIESGIWYKYRIQQYKNSNNEIITKAKKSDIEEPVICTFDDIFLTNKDKQLKIKFNPNISDLKYNVNESQQITLGSQFPYIKRNGNNYYRSFSINGLISALADQQDWYDYNYDEKNNYFYYKNTMETFTTPKQLYGQKAVPLYDNYNEINNITEYKDYIYQREFRQKVMDFLYKNDIKLFRSLTQGNMLIKLNNITFSPFEGLGRMLYSFSAQATEIDKINYENLKKYNIINKTYYTYKTLTTKGTFENGESIINKLYETESIQKQFIDIMELFFFYDGSEDIVVYAKPINNKNFFKYHFDQIEEENGEKKKYLILKYSDSDPIANCYLFGIHLNENEYIETNEYYYSINDIRNPIDNGVYYIVKQNTYKINNYINLYNKNEIIKEYILNNEQEEIINNMDHYNDEYGLNTYYNEIIDNNSNFYSEESKGDYDLLTQSEYYKIIYYKGEWYPFSEDNEVLIDNFTTEIKYTYRIRKEN